jgi:hypothetical protein
VRLYSCGLSPSGIDFARLIVRRPCSNNSVEMTGFLKEERGTSLRKRWNIVLVRSLSVGFFLVSHVEQIVGKKNDGVSCSKYTMTETHATNTIP